MVHQLNGKGSAWSGWVVGAPQAVGEVGRWLHPNPEVGGWVSRWLADVTTGSPGYKEGAKGARLGPAARLGPQPPGVRLTHR